MTGKAWQVIDVTVTGDAREAIEYGLMEAGAVGTETIESANGNPLVMGYFETPVSLNAVRGNLIEALEIYDLAQTSLSELTVRELPEQDWLAEWKKHWQPVEVGRFVIAPPWSELPAVAGRTADRVLICIDPGMAFGTGT
ncbi:MAG TPA: 50S ribosomal protein L11 methyltransferase, partial [Pyrinomonadaceae bacterium]|nr:50S ribosomal protein L11 methyltransferase [Pyrinomonadaceae bacterium]